MTPRQNGKFDIIGSVDEFKGDKLVQTSPLLATPVIVSYDAPLSPFPWFVPGRLSYYKNTGSPVQVTQVGVGELQVVNGSNNYRLESKFGIPLEGTQDNVHFVAKSLILK